MENNNIDEGETGCEPVYWLLVLEVIYSYVQEEE